MRDLAKKLIIGFTTLILYAPAFSFWPSDADTLFNSYNLAFYVGNNGNAYYKNDTSGGGMGFWTGAEEIEMVLDSYARTGLPGTRDMVTALCNGFLSIHGQDWTWNMFNDDIAWACIAFARAYQITGNTTFRDRAKANFDAMYARAWDSNLGGGLWWTTARNEKNACVNGPSSICAYLLYQIYGDSTYLTKAQNIYSWERNTLFNASTGQVYDNINSSGVVNTWVFTYNQGTFIGAANYLGYVADATLAADYTKNYLCTGGILPDSTENSDGGGFNGIFLRWMAKFMVDRGLESAYLRWLQLNANAALNTRRTSDNLSWCNWRTPTPSGIRYSWGCVNAPLALQVIPADGEGVMFCQDIDYSGVPGELIGTGAFTSSQLLSRGVLNNWATSLRVPPGWKVTMYADDDFTGTSWTFTNDTAWIGSDANDQMTSCKIETTGVILYQDAGYLSSRSQTLGLGNYTLTQLTALGVNNDWASSLRVPNGFSVILYADDNFAGASWTVSTDQFHLASIGADNLVSSLKILDTAVPPAPTGLAAIAGNAQVSLTWNTSAGATSYNVKRATVSSGPYTTIATPTGASHTDTGLNNGTTYYYVVSALNAAGQSGNSTQVSGTPTGLTTVSFTSVGAHDGYVLESTETSNVGGSLSATLNTSPALRAGDDSADRQSKTVVSFDTSSLPDNATVVSATLKLRRGTVSGTSPFTTHGTCYADIKGATGFGGSTSLASGDFAAAADASQVAVMSPATANGSWSTGVVNSAGIGFVNTAGHTQFRVYFAVDDNDDAGSDYIGWYSGENSTAGNRPVLEVTYSTGPVQPPPAPGGLSATPGNEQVWLSWDSSTGATSCNVKRAPVSGGPYSIVATPTGTTFTDTGLANGTTYYYVVSAANSGGESGNSSHVSATPQSSVESILEENASGNSKVDVKLGQTGAQSFRHGAAGGPSYIISKLVLYLSRDAEAPNANLLVNIGTGIQSGAISGSSFTIAPSSITDTSAGVTFMPFTLTFGTPFGPLTAGTTYYINLECGAGNGKAVYVQYNGTSTYPNGTFYKSGSDDGKDIRFQIWGE